MRTLFEVVDQQNPVTAFYVGSAFAEFFNHIILYRFRPYIIFFQNKKRI